MNYYEHHIGDFLKKTVHLSAIEEGIYRRLLDRYYTTEAPLPADVRECCKLARAGTKPERDAVRDVLKDFFVLKEDGHHQGRADEEIARFKDKQAKAKRSADARWSAHRSQSEGNANASADDMRTHMRTQSEGNAPRARPQSPVTSNQSLSESDRQSAFAACGAALKRAGISLATINTSDQTYRALIEQGMTAEELEPVAREAVDKRIGKPLPWICTVIQDRRARAAAVQLAPKPSQAKPWDDAI